MTTSTYLSHWVRPPGRAKSAARADGLADVTVGDYTTLERSIHLADTAKPPKGWSWDGTSRAWTFGPWRVEVDAAHLPQGTPKDVDPWKLPWCLLRGDQRATKQVFRTADRARHYAEMRLHRSAGPMRGPRPRGGGNGATVNLPDVRATPRERQVAFTVAESLGLTYSGLARAAVVLLSTLHDDGRLSVSEDGAFVLDAPSES
jgi:hypothetical protein